jgi:hypothetical protein
LGKRCLELQQSAKNGSVRPMWTPQVKACYRRSPAFLKNCLAFVFLRCLFFDLEEFTGSIASLRMHWWKTQRGWSWSHQLIMLPVQNIGVACVHGWYSLIILCTASFMDVLSNRLLYFILASEP